MRVRSTTSYGNPLAGAYIASLRALMLTERDTLKRDLLLSFLIDALLELEDFPPSLAEEHLIAAALGRFRAGFSRPR